MSTIVSYFFLVLAVVLGTASNTFAKSAEKGMENALYNVRGLLEGNGSIPVYITLDAYQKLLAEKKKMNNAPVSSVLTAILEKYSRVQAEIKN